jgi:hypothetical protein
VVTEIFGDLTDLSTTRKETTLLEIMSLILGTGLSISIWKGNWQDYNMGKILVNAL